jgi:hypothetical protein
VAVSAQSAIRAWVNASPIVGEGNPLSRGAYLIEQRSPADGAYTVLLRTSEGVDSPVAEDGRVGTARMQFLVYAGTVDAAENAAKALRDLIETLTGAPQPCGDTGSRILVSDNQLGPFAIPPPPDAGETYAFQVNADFLLTAS